MFRREAKKRGSLYYLTGKKCKYGHRSKRLTSTGQCLKCLASWRAENVDRISRSRKKYVIKNAEKQRQRHRLWCLANPEKSRLSSQNWARANPDRVLARTQRWAKNNPHKIAVKTMRRRARESNARGHFTADDLRTLIERSDGICFFCPKDISNGKHTIEHFIPLARGGTNWPKNLRLACLNCNASKGSKLPSEFMIYRKQRNLPTNRFKTEKGARAK